MPPPTALIQQLQIARRVVVVTGAGVSAESGVPTFRDAQSGLWSKFRPEDLATPEAFERNPKLVWDWYADRRRKLDGIQPNPGHLSLVEWENRTPEFLLVTQNVDGLHHLAGSRNTIELHGNIRRTKCFENNHPVESWAETAETPPRCPVCGGQLRPDVVWFGERLSADALDRAAKACRTCDIFASISTSAVVYPAAGLASEARQSGATILEINRDRTPLTDSADFALQGLSGEILPELMRAAWP